MEENKSKRRRERLGHIAKAVLVTLAISGVILTAVAAPNAIQILGPLLKKKKLRFNDRSLDSSLERLKKERLVELATENEKDVLRITEKGKQRIRYFELEKLILTVPPKWDRQWTIILYDVPEEHKKARDAFNVQIKQIGCFPIHKSVFVHPTDCRDEIDYIAELMGLDKFIFHFRTNSLGKKEFTARKYFRVS